MAWAEGGANIGGSTTWSLTARSMLEPSASGRVEGGGLW